MCEGPNALLVSSRYDHLTRLLTRVTDERPNNVMDVIEDMSLEIKQSYFSDNQRALPNLPEATGAEELAEQHRLLFCPAGDQEEELVFVRLRTSELFFPPRPRSPCCFSCFRWIQHFLI